MLSCEVVILRIEQHALLAAGVVDDAGAQLGAVRATDDQGAQVQSIDLYLVKLGTVDKQIEYLKDVVGRPGIAEAVRSYAAWCSSTIESAGW